MPSDSVELRIPASSAYLALARAATAGICARLDFPLDRLEDLGLAVDEAVSLLLLDAIPGSELTVTWEPAAGGVAIRIGSQSSSCRTPRTTSFAWTVLSALVTDASAGISGDRVTLTLVADREPVGVT